MAVPVAKPPYPADLWARGAHEDFIWTAFEPIDEAWTWGRLHETPQMLAPFNDAQIALWAIWNVDGQIRNGGFIQALENMYGELAEHAIAGLHLFGMDEQADLMAQGFGRFFRPVPMDADERHERMLAVLNVEPGGTYEDVHRQVYARGRALIGDILGRYFDAAGDLDTYFARLAAAIHDRRDQFFDMSEASAASEPQGNPPAPKPIPNVVKALAIVALLLAAIFSIYLF